MVDSVHGPNGLFVISLVALEEKKPSGNATRHYLLLVEKTVKEKNSEIEHVMHIPAKVC